MTLFEKLMLYINNREIDNFKGWLSFVVRNHCISIIRKNKSQSKNIKSYYEFEYEDANYETEEKINTVSDDVMLENMKQLLNTCEKYSEKWLLKYNDKKSCIINCVTKIYRDEEINLEMNGEKLPVVNVCKYLGVEINGINDNNEQKITKFI